MRTCKVFVMPSRFEGWGISGMEANATGKPVLGTRIKGLSEAMVHDLTAILVEPDNPDELAQGLTRLLHNPGLRMYLGEQGRQWAKKKSWLDVAEKQYHFYKNVLAAINTASTKDG